MPKHPTPLPVGNHCSNSAGIHFGPGEGVAQFYFLPWGQFADIISEISYLFLIKGN